MNLEGFVITSMGHTIKASTPCGTSCVMRFKNFFSKDILERGFSQTATVLAAVNCLRTKLVE